MASCSALDAQTLACLSAESSSTATSSSGETQRRRATERPVSPEGRRSRVEEEVEEEVGGATATEEAPPSLLTPQATPKSKRHYGRAVASPQRGPRALDATGGDASPPPRRLDDSDVSDDDGDDDAPPSVALDFLGTLFCANGKYGARGETYEQVMERSMRPHEGPADLNGWRNPDDVRERIDVLDRRTRALRAHLEDADPTPDLSSHPSGGARAFAFSANGAGSSGMSSTGGLAGLSMADYDDLEDADTCAEATFTTASASPAVPRPPDEPKHAHQKTRPSLGRRLSRRGSSSSTPGTTLSSSSGQGKRPDREGQQQRPHSLPDYKCEMSDAAYSEDHQHHQHPPLRSGEETRRHHHDSDAEALILSGGGGPTSGMSPGTTPADSTFSNSPTVSSPTASSLSSAASDAPPPQTTSPTHTVPQTVSAGL